jgi:uncharacterized SAM-binding protein YcdF (DUF218 family)
MNSAQATAFSVFSKKQIPSSSRLSHEQNATSTIENARLTGKWLSWKDVNNVALVTDGFHAPRAKAIFSREYPKKEFWVVFQPRPQEPSNWYEYCERRERVAVLHNLFLHGIWPFFLP